MNILIKAGFMAGLILLTLNPVSAAGRLSMQTTAPTYPEPEEACSMESTQCDIDAMDEFYDCVDEHVRADELFICYLDLQARLKQCQEILDNPDCLRVP